MSKPEEEMSPHDPSSYSRPDHVIVTHMDFTWSLDFTRKVIKGSVALSLKKIDSAENMVILDSSELTIFSVIELATGQKLDFTVSPASKCFGSKITIQLPVQGPKIQSIKIDYETSPKASGLQWLNPKQTSNQTQPFLFSQCQAIHARSVTPCQDSPSVKATYTGKVTAQKGIMVLMSGIRKGQQTSAEGVTYEFSQPVPIPSYLVAIAAGDLVGKEIGPRSTVWAEPDVLEKAAYEFAETEEMLKTAESICGDYLWSFYDLLVLPPSFPYGGMENPNLTFVTPTILAGDRSLADVVVHEITHSWSGNLVTNSEWKHFWLNEGFTMYIERKIIGKMKGTKARHLDAALGWKALVECIKSRGSDDKLTCLVPDLKGVDPDEAFSSVPYEKGHAFLWYLETEILGEEDMNSFLKIYLKKFAYQSITTDQFKSLLYECFGANAKLADIDWDSWLSKPGMPHVELKYDMTLIDCCTSLCGEWTSWDSTTPCPFDAKSLDSLSVEQKILLLSMFVEKNSLPIAKLKKMEELYHLSTYKNCEIRLLWLRMGLLSQWESVVEAALEFVNEQGRMKYTRPIYRDLYAWSSTRERAINNFKLREDTMMQCSIQGLKKDLHLD